MKNWYKIIFVILFVGLIILVFWPTNDNIRIPSPVVLLVDTRGIGDQIGRDFIDKFLEDSTLDVRTIVWVGNGGAGLNRGKPQVMAAQDLFWGFFVSHIAFGTDEIFRDQPWQLIIVQSVLFSEEEEKILSKMVYDGIKIRRLGAFVIQKPQKPQNENKNQLLYNV
ncbi:MAG: hypothetical protein QMD50_02565 [Patescibacteria group bacterium]|nr:hypothetical protein [Patescibacteria group bacterium]